jgi:hypothetical protein
MRRLRPFFPICAVAAAVLAGAAGALTPASIDTDGDGRYSLDELRAFYPGLSATDYARVDHNGDGLVSPSEFRAGQDIGLLVIRTGG